MQITVRSDSLCVALRAVVRASKPTSNLSPVHGVVIQMLRDGRFDVVGANGHWLARWRDTAVNIERADGSACAVLTEKQARALTAWLAHAPTTIEIDFDACTCGGAPLETIDKPFPKYGAIVRLVADVGAVPTPHVGIDAAMLGEACAAIVAALGKRAAHAVLAFGGIEAPIVVTASACPELVIVLMPLRKGAPGEIDTSDDMAGA